MEVGGARGDSVVMADALRKTPTRRRGAHASRPPAAAERVRLAIRCHWCTPVPAAELTEWLEGKVRELCDAWLELHGEEVDDPLVRVTQLVQPLAEARVEDGWLIELELPALSREAAAELLEEAFGEMRVLGLEPTLLAAVEPPAAGVGARLEEPVIVSTLTV